MNKLDEILIRFSKVNDVIRTKREIIEFFKGCVPGSCEREIGDTSEEAAWADGADFSTNWALYNMDKLN